MRLQAQLDIIWAAKNIKVFAMNYENLVSENTLGFVT